MPYSALLFHNYLHWKHEKKKETTDIWQNWVQVSPSTQEEDKMSFTFIGWLCSK